MTDSKSFPYNYPDFVKGIEEWVFDPNRKIPKLGEKAPDFPLWHLGGSETRLSQIWKNKTFTIIEFGSFT